MTRIVDFFRSWAKFFFDDRFLFTIIYILVQIDFFSNPIVATLFFLN